MTGDDYIWIGLYCGASTFGLLMFLNLFWIKYFVRTGLTCDALLPKCCFKSENFMYSTDDTCDIVVMTFFRSFFSFFSSLFAIIAWPVAVPLGLWLFIAWFHKELPKTRKYADKRGKYYQ